MRARDLHGMAIFAPKGEHGRAASTYEHLGKVRSVVCASEGRTVVGVLVKRPDLAGMVKRPDAFVALDALSRCDGGMMVSRTDGIDAKARERLGIEGSWDTCVVWVGMDAVTEHGRELGFVQDAVFDAKTGAIKSFSLGDGDLAKRLVGSVEVPADLLRGHSRGCMVLADEAAKLVPAGGLAARAGAAVGKAQVEGGKMAAQAGEAAEKVVNRGSRALGRQIGKTKGMFGAFMDEYHKASK